MERRHVVCGVVPGRAIAVAARWGAKQYWFLVLHLPPGLQLAVLRNALEQLGALRLRGPWIVMGGWNLVPAENGLLGGSGPTRVEKGAARNAVPGGAA